MDSKTKVYNASVSLLNASKFMKDIDDAVSNRYLMEAEFLLHELENWDIDGNDSELITVYKEMLRAL